MFEHFESCPCDCGQLKGWKNPERRLRQFVFDIVMSECGMDEKDPGDQAYASERVDAWMEHWRGDA